MSAEQDPPAPQRRRWPRLRWSLRWGLRGLGALLLLLLLTVASAVFTETGARVGLGIVASVYGSMIPGDVAFATVEGSLDEGLTIGGLRLEDRRGRPLVELQRLRLSLQPWPALQLQLQLGELEVEGLRVYALEYEDDEGFSDLAPEGPAAEVEPSPFFGPDLPVSIVGALHLRDAIVFVGPIDAMQEQVIVSEARLEVRARGRWADASLTATASLPAPQLALGHVALELGWRDPALTVRGLRVESSHGIAMIERAHVEFGAQRLAIEGLVLSPDIERLSPPAAQWLGPRPRLTFDGSGSSSDLSGDLLVSTSSIGHLAIALDGGLEPDPWLEVALGGELVVPPGLLPIPASPDLEASLSLSQRSDGTMTGAVVLRCSGCPNEQTPLLLTASGLTTPEQSAGRADAVLQFGDAQLSVETELRTDGALAMGATIDAPRLRPLLRAMGVNADIAGALHSGLDCHATVPLDEGTCRVRMQLRDGAPLRRADLDATIRLAPDGQLHATVADLRAAARGATIERIGSDAQLRYGPHGVAIEGLTLIAATRAGTGRVSIDARLDPERTLDGSIQVQSLDLAVIDAFVPGLGLDGTVEATATVQGPAEDLRATLEVDTQDLTVADIAVGDVALSSTYAGQRLLASTTLARGVLGPVTASLELPITIDPGHGVVRVHPRRPAKASVQASDVSLARVATLHPALASLAGDVDLDATLRGSLAHPVLHVAVNSSAGRWDGHPLPDLELDADYARSRASATLVASAPAIGTLNASVSVPVALELLTGRVRWRPRAEHALTLEAKPIQLVELRPWLPDVPIEGVVSVRAQVTGSATDPHAELELHARRVRYDDRAVGRLDLLSRYEDRQLTVQASAAGPAIAGVGLDVAVPLTLDPTRGQVQWHREEPHRLDVYVEDLLLARAMDWLPEPLDAFGRVDARVQLSGSAVDPLVDASLSGSVLRYGGRALGSLDASADYARGRIDTDGRWQLTDERYVQLRAQVPVDVDLPLMSATWQPSRPHSLRVSAPRIDRAMLSPFIELGELYDSGVALSVVADGTATDFFASASIRGVARAGPRVQPVQGRIVLTPTEQTLRLAMGPETSPWLKTDATVSADLPAMVDGTGRWKDIPLAVDLQMDQAELVFLEAFMPSSIRGLEGTIDSHIAVVGTAGAPRLDGTLAVRDGAATLVDARQRIRDFQIELSLDNDGARLSTLTLRSGAGRLTGTGHADVIEGTGVRGTVTLDATKLPILRPGLPRMDYSGGIAATAAYDGTDLDVRIGLSQTRIVVLDSGISAGKPVDTNPGIERVDLSEPGTAWVAKRAEEPKPKPESEPEPEPEGSLTLAVSLDDPLQIVGAGVDLSWEGSVQARSRAGNNSVTGGLRATEGSAELLGNRFEIRYGEITLPPTGSMVPFIDTVAMTTVDGVDISAGVRGRVTRPELTLSSTPAMSQSEIFSALVTGSADTQDADPAEVQAKAASVLAAVSNPALQQQVNERLRIDRIGLSFGDSTQQPILTVGKNITKKLYAETEYHHNAPEHDNGAELRLRYRFAPRWSLETFMGDAASSGLGVFWGRSFNSGRKEVE